MITKEEYDAKQAKLQELRRHSTEKEIMEIEQDITNEYNNFVTECLDNKLVIWDDSVATSKDFPYGYSIRYAVYSDNILAIPYEKKDADRDDGYSYKLIFPKSVIWDEEEKAKFMAEKRERIKVEAEELYDEACEELSYAEDRIINLLKLQEELGIDV